MTYYCPKCNARIKSKDKEEPLPAVCPECGADLYPEEILYQEMICEPERDLMLVTAPLRAHTPRTQAPPMPEPEGDAARKAA